MVIYKFIHTSALPSASFYGLGSKIEYIWHKDTFALFLAFYRYRTCFTQVNLFSHGFLNHCDSTIHNDSLSLACNVVSKFLRCGSDYPFFSFSSFCYSCTNMHAQHLLEILAMPTHIIFIYFWSVLGDGPLPLTFMFSVSDTD